MKKTIFDPGVVHDSWHALNRALDQIINTPLLADLHTSQLAVTFLRAVVILSLLFGVKALTLLLLALPARKKGESLLTFLKMPWYRSSLYLAAAGLIVLTLMLTLQIFAGQQGGAINRIGNLTWYQLLANGGLLSIIIPLTSMLAGWRRFILYGPPEPVDFYERRPA